MCANFKLFRTYQGKMICLQTKVCCQINILVSINYDPGVQCHMDPVSKKNFPQTLNFPKTMFVSHEPKKISHMKIRVRKIK